MSSLCISNCANDARVPIRSKYVHLHNRSQSDGGGGGWCQPPRVVDGISCRQLYLRSYTFSRRETVPERTKKCLDRVRERVAASGSGGGGGRRRRRRKRAVRVQRKRCVVVVVRRVKELSCAALCAIFHKLLSCTATVDVVDHV